MSLTKRLVSGTAQLTLSNGFARVLSIFTMPVLTALLSPEAYGIATLVGTMIALASVFALAGIDMSYTRAYHSAAPPAGWDVEHFCWRFAIGTSVVAALLGAGAWFLIGPAGGGWFAIVVGLGIVLSVGHTMAQVRAQLRARYGAMSLAICVAAIASVACSIGVALWWRQDATGLLLAMLLSYLVPLLMLGTGAPFNLLKPSRLTAGEGRALVKIGAAGVVTAPLYWLLSSSDRWFLQYFAGVDTVGIYSIGYSVAIVGMMVNNAVISVWVPEAAREYERDAQQARVTLGLLMSRLIAVMALIWLAVAAAGGDIVRLLANERFHGAAAYVPYIAGGVCFYGILHLGNTGLLLAKKLQYAILWWVAGGIVCVALNLLLVPRLGGVGAALTQAVSFGLIALGIFFTAWRKVRLELDGWRLLTLLPIVVVSGVIMTSHWHTSPLLSLALKLPVGALVTLIAAWVMVPAWCISRVHHLRRMAFP